MNYVFLKGTIYTALFILAWIGTAFLIKITLSDDEESESESYDKPLFIGYTACSSFAVYSIFNALKFTFHAKCKLKNLPNIEIQKLELKTSLICYPIFFSTITLYYF